MKTCSRCGHQFPDDLNSCPVCETPVSGPDANGTNQETPKTTIADGPTPPVPNNIPPVPEADASPSTRIVSRPVPPSGAGVVPPSGSGAVPPSGAGVVPPSGSGVVPPSGSGAVPPSGSGVVPPSGSGVVPPSGSFNQPPRRNNTVLWIVIGILSAIILIGVTWFIATNMKTSSSSSNDNNNDENDDNVEVVDYETDDTPTQSDTYDADTLAVPDVEATSYDEDNSTSTTSSTSDADATNVITGYLYHSDGDKQCFVTLRFTVDDDNEVSGTASFNNTTLRISGNYYEASKKLLIYENGGGRYEGYATDGSYSGKYYDDAGTWSFNMKLN